MTLLTVMLTILSLSVADTDSVQRLDLAGWVSLALDNSPELRSAEASLLSARASLTGDRSFLWPTLTGSASASRTWSDTPLEGGGAVQTDNDSYSAGLTLSQELLQSGGQNWLYMRASELSLEAAEAEYEGAVLEVVRDVMNSYYDVLEAMELKRAAEDSRERSHRQLQRTENQYEMGAVTTLELLQVQVQESNDRLLVSRREQSLLAALDGLYTASGVDINGNPPGIDPDAVVEPLPLSAVSVIPLDISSSPSLRAAVLRNRSSEIRSDAAGRSYWPSLRASAGWSWNDGTLDDFDRMFDSDAYSIGMSLSWNIFDGFLRESRIKSARAAALDSEASLESLRNNIQAGVRTLRDLLLIDLQYYHDSLLALELAQERYRLSAMSYEMGSLSLIDLLEAQSDLSASEANLVSARASALRSEASLLVELGRMPRVGE